MSDHAYVTIVQYLVAGGYKLATIAAGLLCIWLGYRLFCKGVLDKAGDMEATWGDNKLLLKKASPGTFFALLGSIVLSISIGKGLSFSQNTDANGGSSSTSSPSSDDPMDISGPQAPSSSLLQTSENIEDPTGSPPASAGSSSGSSAHTPGDHPPALAPVDDVFETELEINPGIAFPPGLDE